MITGRLAFSSLTIAVPTNETLRNCEAAPALSSPHEFAQGFTARCRSPLGMSLLMLRVLVHVARITSTDALPSSAKAVLRVASSSFQFDFVRSSLCRSSRFSWPVVTRKFTGLVSTCSWRAR